MISRILAALGLSRKKNGQSIQEVRIQMAEQVKKFNEDKDRINDHLNTLEERTEKLDDEVSQSLALTQDNQKRLESIEENLQKILELSQSIAGQPKPGKTPEID